jgi:cell division protein FtsB
VQYQDIHLTAVACASELKNMKRRVPLGQQSEPLSGVRGWLQRTYHKRRRGATVAAALLALGMGFHVVFGQNGLTAYEQKRHDARVLQEQLKRLQDENQRLQGHVERLQDDPGAIEHQAREELHYTRPGEVIVTLPNEAAATSVKVDSR